MKTYEVVRELVKMMDDNKPEQKKILWTAFTDMFDLMVEEHEHKKVAAVAAKAFEGKTVAASTAKKPGSKQKVDNGKICALYKANWSIKAIADELNCNQATVRYWLKKEGLIK